MDHGYMLAAVAVVTMTGLMIAASTDARGEVMLFGAVLVASMSL